MTLPRYEAICAHWERVPPLSTSAWLIAQSSGSTMPKTAGQAATSGHEQNQNRQALIDLLGGAGFQQRRERPEWQRATATK